MSAERGNRPPLVSVLTPSFNQAQWLGDAIRSVRCQTYPRVEHIVMDGGSSGATLAVLKNAPESVIWRSERDGGQSDALNKALALSEGEIIGCLNSDDAYFARVARTRCGGYSATPRPRRPSRPARTPPPTSADTGSRKVKRNHRKARVRKAHGTNAALTRITSESSVFGCPPCRQCVTSTCQHSCSAELQ